MSYNSQNILKHGTSLDDVIDFLKLFEYDYQGYFTDDQIGKIKEFLWGSRKDYKSWTGIELSLFVKNDTIYVETRSAAGRSYYDLEHQNKTIKSLKTYFGGSFKTDSGKDRCMRITGKPPKPAESGCYMTYNRFGHNLLRAHQYFRNRNFGVHKPELSGIIWLDNLNPRLLSNNLVLPFIASIHEDYWKTIYVVLLKYSEKKEAVLKGGNKISADRMVKISEDKMSVEQGFAESISFTNISTICSHFKTLDNRLDFAAVLKKPYKRRKKTLFDSLEEMVTIRNEIIHRASSPIMLNDDYIKEIMNITEDSIDRCQKELVKIYGWNFYKSWSTGRGKKK